MILPFKKRQKLNNFFLFLKIDFSFTLKTNNDRNEIVFFLLKKKNFHLSFILK